MASPIPKTRPGSQPGAPTVGKNARRIPPDVREQPEVVDPIWLLKAIGVTILAALVCGYLTLCLLFYQGQWQLVLHPSRTTPPPATVGGVTFQSIHFGVDESAEPQLTGWFIPAGTAARYAAYTVLYLPSGDGSLADSVSTLAALHATGLNVFAFDYRGYGHSAPTRPNQARMTADASSAWQYLTVSRGLAASKIVPYGSGVGAALAAKLANDHPEVPAVVLNDPLPDVIQTVLADPRVKWLPVRVLFHESFPITPEVVKLRTPKLFILNADVAPPAATAAATQALTLVAATPKMTSTLHSADLGGPLYSEQITRFLDQNLH